MRKSRGVLTEIGRCYPIPLFPFRGDACYGILGPLHPILYCVPRHLACVNSISQTSNLLLVTIPVSPYYSLSSDVRAILERSCPRITPLFAHLNTFEEFHWQTLRSLGQRCYVCEYSLAQVHMDCGVEKIRISVVVKYLHMYVPRCIKTNISI